LGPINLRYCTVFLCAGLVAACGGSSGDSGQPSAQPAENEVLVAQGRISGSIEGELRVFRGVRYAAPLIPQNRFTAPGPPLSIEETYIADSFGPPCIQPRGDGVTGSEDCLFANIWAHRDLASRPVIVYLHGGRRNGSAGSMPSIDGAAIASSTGAVFVSVNRRLGVLGYLALEELIAENPRRTAGNYGVLDSIQALRWVQDSIAAFNGDPQRVMLVGHSFGGRMICSLLAAPEAAGLFHAVALLSGTCTDRSILSSQIDAYTNNPPLLDEHPLLLDATGCAGDVDVLQCLRNLPAAELIVAGEYLETVLPNENYPFRPAIDGVVVQSDPYTALGNKLVGDVAVIAGTSEKDVEYLLAKQEIVTDEDYRNLLRQIFPPPLDAQLYALYPTADFESPKDAYVMLGSDYLEHCVAEELTRSARGAGMPAYLYLVTRGFDNGTRAGLGALHAIVTIYLFENFAAWHYMPDAAALAITSTLRTGLANVARDVQVAPALTADGGLIWPAYDATTKAYINFDEPVEPLINHSNGRCEELRQLLPL